MPKGPSVHFNRLTGVKCYFLRVFVIGDLFIIVIALLIFSNILSSLISFVVFLFGYTAYLLLFRLNRPLGYDVHKFKKLIKPSNMRPGRADFEIDYDFRPIEQSVKNEDL